MRTTGIIKLIYCLVLFIVIIQSCDNKEVSIIDNTYPTTYKKLDLATLNKLRTDFARANPYLTSSITDFGFCGFTLDYLQAQVPTRIPDLTKSEAQNMAKSFILQNSTLLGVKSSDVITFSRSDSSINYEGSAEWFISTDLQHYGGLEVYDTYMNSIIMDGKVTSCDGNWYPYIYIPPKFNIGDETAAKSVLLNKVVYIYEMDGAADPLTITSKSLETAVFSKMIYPLKITDKIELHVVWVVTIPDVYNVVYLDVMTGKIILSSPTIES